MAKNQSTYTLKIDAELGNLQKTLNEAKTSLATFMAGGNAPKGLEKAFEKINTLLGQISDKTGKPLDLKGLTGAGKDLATVEENFRAIVRLLGEFDDLSDDIKLSFLSPEEQKKVTAITNALKAYGEAAAESAKKVKQLEAAQKTLQKDEGNLGKAKKKVGGIQSKKTSKEAELTGARGRLAAAQGVEGADPEKIAQYQAKVTRLEADLTNLNRELAEANKELTAAQSIYDASAKSVQTLSKEADRAGKESLHKLKEEAKNLGVSLEGLNGHDAAKQIEILTGRLEDFKTEALKGAKPAFNAITDGCAKAGKAAEGLGEDVKEASESVKAMDEAAAQRDAFEAKIKSFLGLSGAAQVLRAALRDAMATITELDATMTQMAVVTDLSVGDYWDQLPEYSKRASELGVSINDAYKAATLYYQQGLKSNEVTAISAETLKLAKIAGIDAAEATDKMTAALRGFNMELNDASAQKIADVYSELAAITAADVDEISTAMTKTASIASSAGMEFETTAAFLSQIIETTRESAETAGTAMKTVIARFQELKKSPNEIGEIDGEIVDANAIETALRSVGVSLRDANGQFRELDDVFLELSSKWNGLDKNTQRYIATIAAGSRQQSRFIAMMQDYGRTQELVTAANNSAGASQEQFAKTMESLEAKIEKLKNAWHEFTMGIMDSDLVKTGVDILTKLLEIINKATDGINGFGGGLVKIVTVLGIFKLGSKLFEKFRQPLISFFADIISESFNTGKKATEQFVEGTKAGKQKVSKDKEEKPVKLKEGYTMGKDGRIHRKDGTFAKEGEGIEESGFKDWISDKSGYSNISTGIKKLGDIKKARKNTANAQKELDDLKSNREFAKSLGASPEELAEIDAEIDKSSQSLDELKKKQKEVEEVGKDAWSNISDGVQQAGSAIMATGTAISMIGGLLSSLGLEQAGSILSDVGQGITMIGSALMIIPPILTLITAHPIIAVITAFLLIVLGSIIAISSYLKSMSADAQLEKAAKDADAAADAAERAAERYEDLANGLDDLKNKYGALEELRRGTQEWNDAVQDVNASVLDLIDKYPELAGFVENKGGVLTLDVDSEEVQDIMAEAKKEELTAKSAAYGAKQTVNDKKLLKEFEGMDAVNAIAEKRAVADRWKGAAVGWAAGAGVLGAIGGAIAGGEISKANTRNDKELRDQTAELSKAVLEGQVEAEEGAMKDFLIAQGMAADEAEIMADQFSHDTDALIAFGQAASASEAAMKSYYQAMATNAQQMLNLGLYSEQELDQMTNIVDEDLISVYQEQAKEELQTMSKEDKQSAKEDFAREIYGDNARVDGNKILDEKGEVVREFTSEEAFFNEIAAAKATKEAADAMEQIPGIINNSLQAFEGGLHDAVNKAFAGEDLTKGELKDFKDAMGQAYVSDEVKTAYANLTAEEQAKYKNEFDYATKTGQLNYEGVDKAWSKLTTEQKKFYGENEEEAKEAFEATYTDIVKEQEKLFANAEQKKIKILGETATLSEKLSSKAAQGWMNGLESISTATNQEATNALNDSLKDVLSGLSAEEAEAAMAQINAIDKTSKAEWEKLSDTFKELGLSIPNEAFDNFIEKGIEASNAIEKINFETFAQDLNNTYKLLDKVKQGGRTYSEEDYKELIAANKQLKDSFTQVGDEFIYVGGSVKDLTEAVEKNTAAKVQEANAALKNQIEIASTLKAFYDQNSFGSVSAMSKSALQEYLIEMRGSLLTAGYDIGSMGIEGLGSETDFAEATEEQLSNWAEQITTYMNNLNLYKEDYTKQMREANILKYSKNEASYNAKMAVEGGKYADEHQEALILQAVQSGGVSDAMIEAYKKAIEDSKKTGNTEDVENIGKKIADATEKIVESNENRDTAKDLIERVIEAIVDQRQKEIDKLSDINDSINTANDSLVAKIQSQIESERQARENEKTEQELSDLYSQRAMMMAQTGGEDNLLGLNQQITEAEQNYQDTLVDQALQNLQDSNAQAAEQRERQIALLEAQLQFDQENGQITAQAEQIVSGSVMEINSGMDVLTTKMGSLLWGSEGEKSGLSDLAKEDWVRKLQTMAISATKWYTREGIVNQSGDDEKVDNSNKLTPEQIAKQKETRRTDAKNLRDAAVSQYLAGQINKDTFNEKIDAARSLYTANNGQQAAFDKGLNEQMNSTNKAKGYVASSNVKGLDSQQWDEVEVTVDGVTYKPKVLGDYNEGNPSDPANYWIAENHGLRDEDITRSVAINMGEDPSTFNPVAGLITLYGGDGTDNNKGELYIYRGVRDYNNGKPVWVKIDRNEQSGTADQYDKLREALLSKYKYRVQPSNYSKMAKYATGGLADFTGPAWLDGTPSKPEYILNAAQTERFFSLIDVLEGYDKGKTEPTKSGDNYFDININVEKLEDDYDVEQMADKIRRMIYDDATYRNVNSINRLR